MTTTPKATVFSDEEEFMQWVGRCITAWADTDEALFRIFCHCMGPGEHRLQCAIIYYRMQTIGARLGLVDDIVRSLFPTPNGTAKRDILKIWVQRKKAVEQLLATRSRIAHHQAKPMEVSNYDSGFGLIADASQTPSYVIHSLGLSDVDARKSELQTPLGLSHLTEHYKSLQNATADLNNFRSSQLALEI